MCVCCVSPAWTNTSGQDPEPAVCICMSDARLLVLLHWTRHSRASVSFPLACLLPSCFVQEKALLSVFLVLVCMLLCQSTSFL